MFGLMRDAPRLSYCGTCKTLGARYGQRARLLLNHDAVFLAEVLTHFAGEPDWSGPYRSYNCLSLPKLEFFRELDYAAAITVMLAQFRVADHCQDSRKLRWRAVARALSPTVRGASARLKAWGFPLAELTKVLGTQADREACPRSVADVAEPTAVATGLVFAHGARIIEREELAESMYTIGYRFGYLTYLLDAVEDHERDAREGNFNVLARFPEVDGRAEIGRVVAELEAAIPQEFAGRLRTNVEVRLGTRLRVIQGACRKPWRERWRESIVFARRMREREAAGWLKGGVVFASVVVLAALFPHQARGTSSWRECLGVGVNLMALGTFFAAPAPPPDASNTPVKAAGGRFWSSCDGCDCCCEGCCDSLSGCDCS